MPDKPLPGGSVWDREGIEPAQAFWVEIEAYRAAINELMPRIQDQELRLALLQLINAQGHSLNRQRDALHTLEIIGVKAKKDRTSNG